MTKTNRNKSSRVQTRIDRTGKLRTETSRRDRFALDLTISTDIRNNSTRLFIDPRGRGTTTYAGVSELNGREARTLFLLLQKHFETQGKQVNY